MEQENKYIQDLLCASQLFLNKSLICSLPRSILIHFVHSSYPGDLLRTNFEGKKMHRRLGSVDNHLSMQLIAPCCFEAEFPILCPRTHEKLPHAAVENGYNHVNYDRI